VAEAVSDTIDIEASPEEIFAVTIDFGSYPEWNHNVKEVRVEETDEQGRGVLVWYRVDAVVKEVAYTLAYDYSDAPHSFSWTLQGGDLKALSGSYSFEDFGGRSEVAYEMSIDPGFPIPGFLKRRAEKQIVKGALDELKKRVEGPG
jgi:hypothetical protein